MKLSRPRQLVLGYILFFTAMILVSGVTPAYAQFDDTFVYDGTLAVRLLLNDVSITEAVNQTSPIVIDLESPMDIEFQINNTGSVDLIVSGNIWFYYQGIALFPIEVRDPATNTSEVQIPANSNVPPVFAQINFGDILSLGPLGLSTGLYEASLEFVYREVGETDTTSLYAQFFLYIPVDPIAVITSVAGVATIAASVGAVAGTGSTIWQLLDGVQTAHKVRSIQKKASEIKSLPNLTVLGALPALFAVMAGMGGRMRRRKPEEEDEATHGDGVSEYMLRQRLREAAPQAWPMDRCPQCKKSWNKKKNFCKKCNFDEEQARQHYAEHLVSKTTKAIKALGKKKHLSIRKLAKRTKSTDYNAGVIGAAMVDVGLTEIEKIETPIRSFAMNIAGLAFIIITWQQLMGGASSQWQTTLTIVGGAMSLGVIVALYFARKSQISKMQVDVDAMTPETPPPDEIDDTFEDEPPIVDDETDVDETTPDIGELTPEDSPPDEAPTELEEDLPHDDTSEDFESSDTVDEFVEDSDEDMRSPEELDKDRM